jgi:hypothetical protein
MDMVGFLKQWRKAIEMWNLYINIFFEVIDYFLLLAYTMQIVYHK